MTQVTKQQIEKAKEVNLLTYLMQYEPNNLVRKGSDYCTKEHDSLSISKNGLWHWCSTGIGGKTALQYLIKVKEMDFVSAVHHLCGSSIHIDKPLTTITKEKKEFILPKPFHNNSKVIDYLRKRGIADNVIKYCIDNKLIYESAKYHNAVFVGYDQQGIARYGALRGTWEKAKTAFKSEITGSDKKHSFKLSNKSHKLIVAESAIDALSVATLRQKFDCTYLSVAGIYAPKTINSRAKLPIALETVLTANPQITDIMLNLDNDDAGRKASAFIGSKLAMRGYIVANRPTQNEKDYNDLIVKMKSSDVYIR